MAANYIVINSKFRPFSYAEMLQPVLRSTMAHQEVENEYAELATKANIWDKMANEQTDPYAYKMYKTFSDDLEKQAGQLAREGLSPASRQNMLKMRQRYSSDIVPIEQAYKRRQELVDEQRKLLAQDSTLMFDRNASMLSLDDLIKNPQLTYQSYSGADLTKQVGTAAQNLAKEMRKNPRKWRAILGNQYFETIMQKGYRPEEIIQVLQNDPNASSVLKGIIEDAVGSSNIASWGDQTTLNRAYEYARQGLWNAVGETQYQTLENWRAKMAEQEAMKKRAADKQNQAQLGSLAINPLNIYSTRKLSAEEKKYNDNVEKYSDYFYKDSQGKIRLNEKGLKEYRRNAAPRPSAGSGTVGLMNMETQMQSKNRFVPTDFKRFIDSIGGNMGMEQGAGEDFTIGEVWENYINNSPAAKTARYDTSKVTEYDYAIDSSQQKDIKNAIMTAGRGSSLREVDYDDKSKTFKDTGEKITMEDLKNDKYVVTNTRFSPYGSTVMIQDDKGNVRRFRMPAGINTTNEENRDRAMQAAYQWQQVVNTGQYIDARGNVHQATPDEITYAQQQYAQAIQQAYLFNSQLGVQNKTKEQEYNPYGY